MKICNIFNTYFTNVTKDLKHREVDKTQSFKNEESCGLIKHHFGNGSFSFKPVSKNDIINAIKKLSSNIASTSNDLPVSVMKQFSKLLLRKTYKYFEQLSQRKQVSKFNESCQFLKSLAISPNTITDV